MNFNKYNLKSKNLNTLSNTEISKQRTSRVNQRRNLGLVILATIGVAAIIFGPILLSHHKSSNSYTTASNSTHFASTTPLAAAETGLLPWNLTSPLSRMAVFPGGSNQLIIAGGLTQQSTSATGVYTLDTTNGSLALTSDLGQGVHDAAAAVVSGGKMVIIGGGSVDSYNTAQTLSVLQGVTSTATLPQLRSDATAVTLNNTTYIIGGYDGSRADSQVLTTTDGKNFNNFGPLPVPVRYAAAAAFNNQIYVFGGIAVNGPSAGQPINTIQIINPKTNTISLASWKLPLPLEGASAVVLAGEMFLIGGQSNIVQTVPLGMGTTQVSGISPNGSNTSGSVWAVDPTSGSILRAGQMQVPVSNAGVAVLGSTAWIVGGESNGQVVSVVQMLKPNIQFGNAGALGAGSPYFGDKLLVADRGNNRILLLDSTMNIIWKYPSATTPVSNINFYFPDDAFFSNNGQTIISNQENNNTIVKIAFPSGQITWTFGHPLLARMTYGYLSAPDDAYQLKNGQVVVADDQNCRVLFINQNGTVAAQIGENGVCVHNPPISLGSPNGDTPLYDGNILISEIFGSWVSEYTPSGKLVWTAHIPISYASDPQQLGASPGNNPNLYLIADYSSPGAIVTFNRSGTILSRYQPQSGPGMLDHPSLVELLPSGVYMANDDYRDRMVAIDPGTGALVWQYGISDQPGTAPGMLNQVDGFDLLLPNGTTPTHGATG